MQACEDNLHVSTVPGEKWPLSSGLVFSASCSPDSVASTLVAVPTEFSLTKSHKKQSKRHAGIASLRALSMAEAAIIAVLAIVTLFAQVVLMSNARASVNDVRQPVPQAWPAPQEWTWLAGVSRERAAVAERVRAQSASSSAQLPPPRVWTWPASLPRDPSAAAELVYNALAASGEFIDFVFAPSIQTVDALTTWTRPAEPPVHERATAKPRGAQVCMSWPNCADAAAHAAHEERTTGPISGMLLLALRPDLVVRDCPEIILESSW